MELPVRIERPVHRVATWSSTKNRELERRARKDRRRIRSRKSEEPDDSSSDSSFSPKTIRKPNQVTPIASVEKGVEENRIPRDVTREVRKDLAEPEQALNPPSRKVRFDENPVVIQPDLKPDEYDIIQDIKEQKANATIEQLLHDNPNYQKLVKEEWPKKRRRKFRLLAVAVNFAQVEDYGAPELVVEVDGCTIPKVPVDGRFGVNLMLESTAFDLGYTTFEETDQILQMADQSRVVPAGRLSQIPTRIGKVTYLQNFVIIRVGTERPFPMLQGRPWLYSAKVLVDWSAKEFIVGKPSMRIPWKAEKYLGETSDSDRYTSSWTDPKESDSIPSYLVAQFAGTTEADFGFTHPVQEEGHLEEPEEPRPDQSPLDDKSLGEIDVPFTVEWIRDQIAEGLLPADESRNELPWSEIRTEPEESDPDRIKSIFNPTDYSKVKTKEGKAFYLANALEDKDRQSYVSLLSDFSDVFAWSPFDLTGISPGLGEHKIDLVEGAVSIRQRQYRLNPRYSLMVKEDIDRLLEAGFIYPVVNSEWISPIVVVPKKVGADGKVKIRVCQDFKKLNASTKKDYFQIPFMNIILDHVSSHECYNFLDGFSGYNQVFIRPEDQLKTTFTIEWGTFAFNRMLLGLCNAPGTFQRLMMDIFQDFLRHFLEVFIDNFAVFSTKRNHLNYLKKTFERCRETNLKLHPGKCFLGMKSDLLSGHVVSKNGLKVDLDKVKVILALTAPTNVQEIQGFLGCVGYYRRFIKDYA